MTEPSLGRTFELGFSKRFGAPVDHGSSFPLRGALLMASFEPDRTLVPRPTLGKLVGISRRDDAFLAVLTADGTAGEDCPRPGSARLSSEGVPTVAVRRDLSRAEPPASTQSLDFPLSATEIM